MIESYLRNPYQSCFVDPVAKQLVKKPSIPPSAVTLLSLITGVATLPFIVSGYPYFAILLLLLSGYCDTLDGTLARMSKRTSPGGAVLDIVSDRAVEFSIILGLFLVNPIERGLISIMMLGSILLCISSFLVVGIFSEKEGEKSFHYSPGIMERFEAFLFFIAMIAFPDRFFILGTLFSALVLLTAFIRVIQFLYPQL